MIRRLLLPLAGLGALLTLAVVPAGDAQIPGQPNTLRSRLKSTVKVRHGMLGLPALSALWVLPEQAARYNVQVEQVVLPRLADARAALAAGELELATVGPHDIPLALGQGVTALVGIAGLGSGGDCLLVRKGEDVKDWAQLTRKTIGIGPSSPAWLKFAASAQEHQIDHTKLKLVNVAGGGGGHLKSLQGREIDVAVLWQPFCAQGVHDGFAQKPALDLNKSRTVGGLVGVLAVNRQFMEKNRDAVQRLVVAYVDAIRFVQINQERWTRLYAEKAGLSEAIALEALRASPLDVTMPLESIKRIGQFLHETGVINRDVSADLPDQFTYEFLSKATGRSPRELGKNR